MLQSLPSILIGVGYSGPTATGLQAAAHPSLSFVSADKWQHLPGPRARCAENCYWHLWSLPQPLVMRSVHLCPSHPTLRPLILSALLQLLRNYHLILPPPATEWRALWDHLSTDTWTLTNYSVNQAQIWDFCCRLAIFPTWNSGNRFGMLPDPSHLSVSSAWSGFDPRSW